MNNMTARARSDSELFLAVARAAKRLNESVDWREGITQFLEELGISTGSSRVWMFRLIEKGDDYYITEYIHEWAARPELSNFDDLQLHHQRVEVKDDDVKELYEARLRGEWRQHHRCSLSGHLLNEFVRQSIHSMLTIPIMVNSQWWGILGFDDCDKPKSYPESYVAALEIASVLLTNAILRARLHWEANHDYLTALFNRRHLIKLIEQALQEHQPGQLTILDIDFFKRVNDEYGHQAGDAALVHLSDTLKSRLPAHALLARFGGEEFALWQPDTSEQNSVEADELRKALDETPFIWEGKAVRITASFGTTYTRSGQHKTEDNFETLFARADSALLEAKLQGRNRVVVVN
ncbi:sensor domain-containing diguanylate cyclase [Nitrincola sp. MINF-07-Sa-05]|uniref:sensor domain-containing diguanylate cyclase n=1 Tax=Nitrincola salilacus TaxID=3400273 RepID=UPI00391816DA